MSKEIKKNKDTYEYRKGYHEAQIESPRKNNPYSINTQEYRLWNLGYDMYAVEQREKQRRLNS